MIQLDPSKLRALKTEVWSNVILIWIARSIFLVCVFACTQNIFLRIGAVCVLTIVTINQWFILISTAEKIDGLQLKLWMDELTWRTAFGEIRDGSKQPWDDVIRGASKFAISDINSVQESNDIFAINTPTWLSVPLKTIMGLALIIAEAALALWATPYIVKFLISVEASPVLRWWIQ